MLSAYDLCIVGAGMVGSSTGRHAKLIQPNMKVCLIGPDEPKNKDDAAVFASYYDEGRITRRLDADPLWSRLATDSIRRYRQLEAITGIQFYNELGCLHVNQPGDYGTIQAFLDVAKSEEIPLEKLTAEKAMTRFPYLRIPDDYVCFFEGTEAGTINPRRLVEAEQKAAAESGVEIIRDVVEEMEAPKALEMGKSLAEQLTTIKLQGGRHLLTKKILVAAGAFTGFRKLLPNGMSPDVELRTQVVTFGEVSEIDAASLSTMPSITWSGHNNAYQSQSEEVRMEDGCYILPPIRYPDGKYYIKIGHGRQFEEVKKSEEEAMRWYRQLVPENIEQALESWLKDLFPEVSFLSFHSTCCLTTHTPTSRPYIDAIASFLTIAIGGNGYAAKSCDEFGRIGVELALNDGFWKHDLPADWFRFRSRTEI